MSIVEEGGFAVHKVSVFLEDGPSINIISESQPEIVKIIAEGPIGPKGDSGGADFLNTSSSFADRISTFENKTVLSSSAQIASDISGAFTSFSSSDSTRMTTVESYVIGKEVLSSSAQIASDISGAFTSFSSSDSTRMTTVESYVLGREVLSSSAQIASDISGAFTLTSSSLSSRVTTLEAVNSVYYPFYAKNTNTYIWSSEIESLAVSLSESNSTIILSASNGVLKDKYILQVESTHSSSYSYNISSTGSIYLMSAFTGSGLTFNTNPNSLNVYEFSKVQTTTSTGSYYLFNKISAYSSRLPVLMSVYTSSAATTITLSSGSNLVPYNANDYDLIVSTYGRYGSSISTPSNFTQSTQCNDGVRYFSMFHRFAKSGTSFVTSGGSGYHFHFKGWNFNYHSMSVTSSLTSNNSGIVYFNRVGAPINTYVPGVTSSYVIHSAVLYGSPDTEAQTGFANLNPSWGIGARIKPVITNQFTSSAVTGPTTQVCLYSAVHGYYSMSNVPIVGGTWDFDVDDSQTLVWSAMACLRIDNIINM